MGKRKHSKIAKENHQVDNDDQIEEEKIVVLPPKVSTKKKKKKKRKKTSHASISSSSVSTINSGNSIGSEMIKKWNQIISLQDTLQLILGFIPDYLLERTMRFVNRDFYLASSVVFRELKTCLKLSKFNGDEKILESWKKFKNLKSIDLEFKLGHEEFNASGMTDFGIETCIINFTNSVFSKPLVGTKWADTLRYLDICIQHQQFCLLFELSLHTLIVELQEDSEIDLKIGKEEKPLFNSLTYFNYSLSTFNNMEEFINRLVNLTTLRSDDEMNIELLKLPKIKMYDCAQFELEGIPKAFPRLEHLKSSSFLSTADILQALTLKTLKTLSLNVNTSSFDLLSDAIFSLPLLEKLSLFINFSSSENNDVIASKPLPYLKKVKLVLIDYDDEIPPVSISHFNQCENIEKISFLDEARQISVDLNDFSPFSKLKSILITCKSVSNWKNPVSTLEILSITTEKASNITLIGLDKLREIDFVSENTSSLVKYFNHHAPCDGLKKLNISGKDILKYPFPSNLESLTISNLELKETDDNFTNILKKQTNLRKIVIEESKLDLLSILETLTCLIHQVTKISIAGKSSPTHSESKYITNLLRVLSIFDSKRIILELTEFSLTFSHQGTRYLRSQIKSRLFEYWK
ncbi:predicted protein [Naegleria gruberi]|uniref:Predicted protein n=1 Tax=Naegleria gruberi TaxID=5762 RepID=D2VRI0_NAEGR|nr:uncharacterized protein NAEGRDRAFT_51688 [Naegleria gruberi]EFC40607.1 predicted protein [Naegleria gruberi]|eukprot:XP_002673351.1 predicted protein [Naegleria gruberi strain NEG-M]